MILVTGATGKLGRLVVNELMKRIPAAQVIAGARDQDKAKGLGARGLEVRKVDYDDVASLDAALRGVRQVLLVSGTEPNRVEQHRAMIDAARRAGVEQLAYTSGPKADTSKMLLLRDHAATEKILKESGVPFTVLRNCWYVENYTESVAPALERGVMAGDAGTGKVSVAPRADYAEAAAAVLTSNGHEGKVYELGGDEAYTLAEIAAEIARVTGRKLVYQDMPEAEYAALLHKAGMPEGFARLVADVGSAIQRGELLVTSGDLRRLLGRPTTPLAAAVERALA
jgi:NAD(P)H dehydrogenase (quinone)